MKELEAVEKEELWLGQGKTTEERVKKDGERNVAYGMFNVYTPNLTPNSVYANAATLAFAL